MRSPTASTYGNPRAVRFSPKVPGGKSAASYPPRVSVLATIYADGPVFAAEMFEVANRVAVELVLPDQDRAGLRLLVMPGQNRTAVVADRFRFADTVIGDFDNVRPLWMTSSCIKASNKRGATSRTVECKGPVVCMLCYAISSTQRCMAPWRVLLRDEQTQLVLDDLKRSAANFHHASGIGKSPLGLGQFARRYALDLFLKSLDPCLHLGMSGARGLERSSRKPVLPDECCQAAVPGLPQKRDSQHQSCSQDGDGSTKECPVISDQGLSHSVIIEVNRN